MEIKKYKYLSNGRYKVYFDDKDYIIYEDVILKYNILSKKNITSDEISMYLKDNTYYDCYYKAIKYIKLKLRCEKELISYLKKNSFSNDYINKAISKLKSDGYLNDEVYVRSYINDQINLKLIGPLKIKKDLLSLGFNEELINLNMKVFSSDLEISRIDKIINKEIHLNKSKSSYFLKQKLYNNLIIKGYHDFLIKECLENISIKDDEIYNREYKKLYDKYKGKYSEDKLIFVIKSKLYQKGFRKD
ncbi:MAG: RecX family transcriptional regulator [bacterium]|nr:RecX family transcriptional regulator [bacterium]